MAKGIPICVGITIIVLGGIAVFIAWLADRMKSPSFTIASATLTGYNLTAENNLNATFSISIASHNRDPKYSIKYKAVAVVVYLNGSGLAYDLNVLDGPIHQAHGKDVSFKAQPKARNALISNDDMARELRREAKVGWLDLEVRVRATVRFEVKNWKHESYTLKVICSPVIIDMTSGKSTFQGTICKVDRF